MPNRGQAAEIAFQTIFPQLVLLLLLQDIERLRDLALSHEIALGRALEFYNEDFVKVIFRK
jgi:hypothetical protein